MKLKGNRAKLIATFGIASALVFGAGGTALAAHSMSLSSASLISTVSTDSVKSADQKLGLSSASDDSSNKAKESGSKKGAKSSGASSDDDSVSSKQLTKKAARVLPKHSVSEADELEKSGAALEEKLEAGKAVDAKKYSQTTAGADAKWKSTMASTYGEGDGLMGSTCSDGSKVTETSMGVAHKTLALGTKIQIMYDGKIVEATVCDRGPFVQGREIDLQPAVRKALGFSGVGTVKYRVVK